ncbi:MAG TPA: hypothetical protein VNQ77_13285 [Frankiaceae bacterium]|nr:hypothetical protein [Frankiaceae bacterium]
MLSTLIVVTALLLAALGLRAERRGRARELWLCNLVALVLVALTASAHASGQIG